MGTSNSTDFQDHEYQMSSSNHSSIHFCITRSFQHQIREQDGRGGVEDGIGTGRNSDSSAGRIRPIRDRPMDFGYVMPHY